MADSASPKPTLYEWAGGDALFARLIDCFYDLVERDELISPLFPGGVSREHRDHVTACRSRPDGIGSIADPMTLEVLGRCDLARDGDHAVLHG